MFRRNLRYVLYIISFCKKVILLVFGYKVLLGMGLNFLEILFLVIDIGI